MSEPESGSDKSRKMADIRPKQYEGIGPTTKDGMPIILRSVSWNDFYFYQKNIFQCSNGFYLNFRKSKKLINPNGTKKCTILFIKISLMVCKSFFNSFSYFFRIRLFFRTLELYPKVCMFLFLYFSRRLCNCSIQIT